MDEPRLQFSETLDVVRAARRLQPGAVDKLISHTRALHPTDSSSFGHIATFCGLNHRSVSEHRKIIDIVLHRAIQTNEVLEHVFEYACLAHDDEICKRVMAVGFTPSCEPVLVSNLCAKGCLSTFRHFFPTDGAKPLDLETKPIAATIVSDACKGGNADIIDILVTWGFPKDLFYTARVAGSTPFHTALINRQYAGIDTLCKSMNITTADLRTDPSYATGLKHMARIGDRKGFEWMLGKGLTKADMLAGEHMSPFSTLLMLERTEIADMLDRELGITPRDLCTIYPVQVGYMATHGKRGGVDWLMQRGGLTAEYIRSLKERGYDPMTAAGNAQQFEIISYLVELGLAPSAPALCALARAIVDDGVPSPQRAQAYDALIQIFEAWGDTPTMQAAERAVLDATTPWETVTAWMDARVMAAAGLNGRRALRALQFSD